MSSTADTENQDDTRLAPKIDWVQLPAKTTAASLWDSLHDAELIAIRSDLLDRTVMLTFRIWHLNAFHKLPDDCRFSMELLRVSSVRATRWSRWPGEFQVPPGTSRAEESRLIDEYQAKWREESASWSSLEEQICGGNSSELEISNAELAVGPGAVALRLETQSNDQGFQVLTIAAEELRIGRTQDVELTVDEFIRLGNDYWTAFANS
jgi:hypothetical protein